MRKRIPYYYCVLCNISKVLSRVMHQYNLNKKRFAMCFTCESLYWLTVYAEGVLFSFGFAELFFEFFNFGFFASEFSSLPCV